MRKIIVAIVVLWFLTEAFDSVVRWVLSIVHADPLIYIRDAGLLILLALSIASLAAEKRSVIPMFALIWALIIGSCVSLASSLGALQILFGLKVWVPFVVGFALVNTGACGELAKPKACFVLWGIICAGIIINHFYRYPWVGLSLTVGNHAVEGNREWEAAGVQRLSGFSRNSNDAAVVVFILYAYLVTVIKGPLARLSLMVISGASIVLTTSKGLVGVFGATLFIVPMLERIRGPNDWKRWLLVSGVIFIAVACIVLPIVSLQLPFPKLTEGTPEHALFASLVDRAWDTWPRSFALISDWQVITGRGIGGIGVSQQYFEPGEYVTGDNLFVYVYVTGGLVGLVFCLFAALSSMKLDLQKQSNHVAYILLFCMFGYGLVSSIIESGELCMVLGALMCLAVERKKAVVQPLSEMDRPVSDDAFDDASSVAPANG
jgi:hypothetical protein